MEQGAVRIIDALLVQGGSGAAAASASIGSAIRCSLARALHEECHMSEVRRELDESGRSRHSIVRLVLENPISAFNTAAIIFGGGLVYASNENRMQQMNERIIKIEAAGLRDASIAAAKDDRTAAKFETITRDLGDVKVTVGRTEEAVRYLVRTMQEGQRRSAQ